MKTFVNMLDNDLVKNDCRVCDFVEDSLKCTQIC